MNQPLYKFNPAKHGVFVEIYLPKKAAFQGTLFESLTEGFDLNKVKAHLTERQPEVQALLKDSRYCGDYERRVKNMRQVFTGYSMYEVDGVFYGGEGCPVDEERTQIVRIMFLPNEIRADTSALPPELKRDVIREYIRFSGDNYKFGEHFLSTQEGLTPEQEAQVRNLVADLRDWEAEQVLFLFGYVMFNLCEKIQKLGGTYDQAEIWITSFWNLSVNVLNKFSPVES
ncbi:MAG: hypothetical protein ACJ76J_01125 [Thermoanaerobaculia bacterium]